MAWTVPVRTSRHVSSRTWISPSFVSLHAAAKSRNEQYIARQTLEEQGILDIAERMQLMDNNENNNNENDNNNNENNNNNNNNMNDDASIQYYQIRIDGAPFQTGAWTARIARQLSQSSLLLSTSTTISQSTDLWIRHMALTVTTQQAIETLVEASQGQIVHTSTATDFWLLDDLHTPMYTYQGRTYTSIHDLAVVYTCGNDFDVIVSNIAVQSTESTTTSESNSNTLSVDDMMELLDPEGTLRQQAAQAGMALPDEDTLKDIALDNQQRAHQAPRAIPEPDLNDYQQRYRFDTTNSHTTTTTYRVLSGADLLHRLYTVPDSSHSKLPDMWKHVMQGLVLHGYVLVDISDMNEAASTMARLWQDMESLFAASSNATHMPLTKVPDMPHAMLGYASYPGMQFWETRMERATEIVRPPLPVPLNAVLADVLRNVTAPLAQAVVTSAVAASSVEAQALSTVEAWQAARQLAHTLVDTTAASGRVYYHHQQQQHDCIAHE
jgi:hypothetical protein